MKCLITQKECSAADRNAFAKWYYDGLETKEISPEMYRRYLEMLGSQTLDLTYNISNTQLSVLDHTYKGWAN